MAKRGNGEGTIYYSEKLNKWVGQFTAGRKLDGKLNRQSVYGDTRKEVKEKVTQKISEIQNKTFIDKNDITLLELMESMIKQQYTANLITPTSYKRKLETFNLIKRLDILNMKIQDISILDINKNLVKVKDYSNSVISKVCGLISSTLDVAVLQNIISSNPFNIKGAVIKPKSTKNTKVVDSLTIEEQKLFLNELSKDYKYKDIFLVAIYTGMRIGEILALTKDDIDMDNKIIKINKTLTKNSESKTILGKTTKTYAGLREIPFSDVLIPIFDNLLVSKNKYLFFENNNFITPSTINSHFKRICKNANIRVIITKKKKHINKDDRDVYINLKTSNVNTHMLRHTFATRCIESGMSAVVLQKLLGHKDIKITLNTYTSVFNKFKQDEFEKLEIYLNKIF